MGMFYALRMQRDLWDYEIKAGKKGYRLIAGVDEAGRGPLAGPVVAAAVVLPADAILQGLNDSKKLSPTRREELFPKIQTQAVVYGVAVVNPEVPDLLLIDGNQKTASSIEQWAIVKGDSKSLSIAAASVLAKVTRDHIMQDYHQLYPQYEFARHKGYGTKLHRDLIAEHGPCPIHRSTFKGVTEYLNR